MKTSILALLIAAALFPAVSSAQVAGMTLDQENENYGWYGFSYSGWQSFTAGPDGFLGAVQLWLYSRGAESGNSGGGAWTATLRIYEGEGTSGPILASQAISGDGLLQRRTFVLETPVRQTAGSKYTIYFGGATTQLTVRMSVDNYAGGTASWSDKDLNFKTQVISSDWSEEAYRDTSFTTADTVISTAAQLAQFAYLVNNGARFSGMTVTLANDISLAGHFWTPISTGGAFSGTFDGTGKTIRCVIIDRPDQDTQGLFGFAGGQIQNVNLEDVDITGHDYVGGLIADGIGGYVNCRVSGKVTGRFYVGGVLGYGHGTTEDCINRCSVDGYSIVGGVVGLGGNDTVLRCRNEGNVYGYSQKIGGVMGEAQGDIVDCINTGAVVCTTAFGCGGIVGATEHWVRNSRNSGSVSGGGEVGGILGRGCEALSRCVNSGSVTGFNAVGGIAGSLYQGYAFECVNQAAVVSSGTAGGLAGIQEGTIINSVNTGSVTGGEGVGGLMGISQTSGEYRNCQNSGPVSGTSSVGALAGGGGVFTNSYWKQTGVAPFNLDASGDGATVLTDCRAFGDAPGTLNAPVTLAFPTAFPVTTTSLSGALNTYVVGNGDLYMGGLRRWTSGSATAYPALADTRWSDPGNYSTAWFNPGATQHTIGTAQELAGLAVLVNGGERFTGHTVTLTADITLTDREWTPIGHVFSPALNWFHGTLEGNGKTITGAWQDGYEIGRYELAGLFGVLDQLATVRNLAVVDSQSVGGSVSGGIAGYQQGRLQNCSSRASVYSYEIGGALVGINGEQAITENCYVVGVSRFASSVGTIAGLNMGSISNCYWRYAGDYPLFQNAIGDGNAIIECSSFIEAPGTLASNVTAGGMTTNNLSIALNAWVDAQGGAGSGLYNWTAGTATRLPRLTPVIKVGETPVPQTLTEGFAAGVSLTATANTVTAYTSAHPGTTATSLGDVLSMADAMGLTFADLTAGQAILNFRPNLMVKGFDRNTWSLTFAVDNGIDPTATAAMNRLAGSAARLLKVEQMYEPGGAPTPLPANFQFHGDGTAHATFEFPNPPPRSFFRLALEHHPE